MGEDLAPVVQTVFNIYPQLFLRKKEN